MTSTAALLDLLGGLEAAAFAVVTKKPTAYTGMVGPASVEQEKFKAVAVDQNTVEQLLDLRYQEEEQDMWVARPPITVAISLAKAGRA
jgi:hypothetical protein